MTRRPFLKSATSLSALALATVALPVVPELLGASAPSVFEQTAEASTINRTRLKQRANGLFKSSVKTQTDPDDTTEIARIEINVPITFGDGGDQQSVVLDIDTPDTVTAVYMSDLSLDGVDKMEFHLNPRDGWCDLNFPLDLSIKSSILEGNSETIEDPECAASATVRLRENSQIKIAIKGAAETIGGLTAEEPATLILRDSEGSVLKSSGGGESSGTFERLNTTWVRNWRLGDVAPPGADDPEFATVTAFDADGQVLDSSSIEIEPAVPRPSVVFANIRRNKLKQRNNGLFRMRAATGSILNEPETTADSVEFKLSYTNSFSEQIEEIPVLSTTPQRIRLNADISSGDITDDELLPVIWDSPVYGPIELNLDLLPPAAEREDGQMGTIICDGVVVEEKPRGCKPVRIAAIDKRGDGSRLKISVSGRPQAFGDTVFSTALYGEILISGDPIEFDEDRIWVEEPPTASPSVLDGQGYQLSTTSFNANGEIIDISTVEGIGGEDDVSAVGLQFGRSFIAPSDAGNLQFDTSVSVQAESTSKYGMLYEIVENDLLGEESDDAFKINVAAQNTTTGTALIDRTGVTPTWRESGAVWTNLNAIEPDNVVDMEYIAVFEVISPEGEFVEEVRAFVVGSENPEEALTITYAGENRIGVALSLNEDGETFTLRAKGARTDRAAVRFTSSPGYAFLLSRIDPDDGGTEFDLASTEPDKAEIQAFFSIEGSSGLGDLTSTGGGDLDIKARASGNSEIAVALVNLTVKDVKELSKAFGFGSGTKKSTTTTSARPELQ
ncbi:MAG: hypothetical protein AAGI14_08485 [Pseudomonadota bacterium]